VVPLSNQVTTLNHKRFKGFKMFSDGHLGLPAANAATRSPLSGGRRAVVHCLQANPPSKTTALPSEKKQESGPSSGTGFFVADGYVLTNYHVIKDCTRRATVAYPNYKPEDAYNAGVDETNDLALLSTKMQNRGTAEFRYQPKLGETVAAYGFPLGQILAAEGNFTLGNVTSVAGLGGDSRHFQISAPIQPGNSGGPVMDASGRVAGVAISSLDTIKMVTITGHIPQNVNFAISASIAINFLAIKDVAPRIAGTAVAQKLEPEKLAGSSEEIYRTCAVRITWTPCSGLCASLGPLAHCEDLASNGAGRMRRWPE
jgi:S1-C subfamily serine protease